MDFMPNSVEPRRLMSLIEVATAFQASPQSVRLWAKKGLVPSFHTPGGHLRFYADEIEPIVEETMTSRTEAG